MYLIHHFLEKSADASPNREAVVHGTSRFSYSDVEKNANRIANWLLESGLNRGDRIALLLRNSVEYIISYFGVLKAGGAVVPLNTGISADETGEILIDCAAGVLITETHFSKLVEQMLSDSSTPCHTVALSGKRHKFKQKANIKHCNLEDILRDFSADRPDLSIIDQDLSSIIYTSGSTGKPKGAMLTHLNVVANTRSIVSYLELTQNDRCLVVLPFYYVYGKSLLNTHFAASGTVIIDNRFAFPNAVLKTMDEEKATGLSGVPSTYTILVNKSALGKMEFPYLRYLTQAGGHMPTVIKERLIDIFPDKQIFIMYGATEASARLSYLDPNELPEKINSIGKSIPNVELKILMQDGTEADIKEEGEIVARGSNIMKGYWNDRKETEKVLKGGWYYTGDLGKKDKNGYVYITGRKRDMIKVGIHKVSAIEIEEVLYRYPGIQEAAVIGVPDDILGESLRAVIVPQVTENLKESTIIQFCKEELPGYKVPSEIVFSKSLPKNEAGKILKKKLLERFI